MTSPDLFDLHVHSTRSDGLCSPMELARLARLSGLAGIAITDHDILPDAILLREIESQSSVRMLVGVEWTTRWKERGLHLLAYRFDPASDPLRRISAAILEQRRARWDSLVSKLRARGLKLDRHRLDWTRNQSSPGRLHLARELVASRNATCLRTAFARFLEPISNDAPSIGVDLATAIGAVHQAGGLAVLAHPPTGLSREDWFALADLGLDGIETRFGLFKSGHRRFLEERAVEHAWIATAGSDYHGDGARDRIGVNTVDRSIVDRMLSFARSSDD